MRNSPWVHLDTTWVVGFLSPNFGTTSMGFLPKKRTVSFGDLELCLPKVLTYSSNKAFKQKPTNQHLWNTSLPPQKKSYKSKGSPTPKKLPTTQELRPRKNHGITNNRFQSRSISGTHNLRLSLGGGWHKPPQDPWPPARLQERGHLGSLNRIVAASVWMVHLEMVNGCTPKKLPNKEQPEYIIYSV